RSNRITAGAQRDQRKYDQYANCADEYQRRALRRCHESVLWITVTTRPRWMPRARPNRPCVGLRTRFVFAVDPHFVAPLAGHSRLRPGIREEQLLAVDAVRRERILALRRNQPIDELLPELAFDIWVLLRIHEHHAVLIEQSAITLDKKREIATIDKRQPRSAVDQNVRVHRRRDVERRTHAGPRVAIPRTFRFIEVDARILPVPQFRRVGAAAIAARDGRRFAGGNPTQCGENVLAAARPRGIVLRTNQDEIVVHHWMAAHALPFCHEFIFGRAVVNEYDVGIATPADVECLARAHRDDASLDTGVALECRQ